MLQEETKIQIRTFLEPSFKGYDLKDDEDFFASGFVSSLFAMQLVLFLEKQFGIQIDTEDLDFENFNSIDAITHFIHRKSAATASP